MLLDAYVFKDYADEIVNDGDSDKIGELMAENSRPSKEALMQTALDAVPETGEIDYAQWYNNLVQSGNHAAVGFYRELKARGFVRSNLTAQPDGKIVHTIGRVR